MVNSNAEERPGSVRPLEQALELLLEQQVGERNVVFEGFLRDRGMAGRFELQVGVDFALLSDEFEAGASSLSGLAARNYRSMLMS